MVFVYKMLFGLVDMNFDEYFTLRADCATREHELLCQHGLKIGNTFFQHKDIHKKTWLSPDNNTWNEIDYICINNRWGSSLSDVRVFRGADHRSADGQDQVKLKRSAKKKTARPYAVAKLKDPEISRRYESELSNRFTVLQEDLSIEEKCELSSTIVKASAETVIGRRRGSNRALDIRQNLEPYR